MVLLIRDAYSHWGLPKGHLEADETAEGAALREVREETGLDELVLGPHLQTIDWYFQSSGAMVHKFCHFYLIEAPLGEPLPQLDEGITECCWLTFDAALERVSYVNAREVVRMAAERLGPESAETG